MKKKKKEFYVNEKSVCIIRTTFGRSYESRIELLY